jgi:hypothetical protein
MEDTRFYYTLRIVDNFDHIDRHMLYFNLIVQVGKDNFNPNNRF